MNKQIRINKITNCHQCQHISEEKTPGAGYAIDYYCNAVTPRKIVAGYVEWDREKRKGHDFPDFCPLEMGCLDLERQRDDAQPVPKSQITNLPLHVQFPFEYQAGLDEERSDLISYISGYVIYGNVDNPEEKEKWVAALIDQAISIGKRTNPSVNRCYG